MARPVVQAIAAAAALAALASPFAAQAFDLQGHRGTRGLAPENTLPAFATALSLGVDTLELDTGVTKDGVVVISHEPRLHPDTARGPDGAWLSAPGAVIHESTYAELLRYDVGRLNPATAYGKRYPEQKPVDGTRIPAMHFSKRGLVLWHYVVLIAITAVAVFGVLLLYQNIVARKAEATQHVYRVVDTVGSPGTELEFAL